jgi:hypothetical protein
MANAWFRLYSEFADDPKVQMMSESMQRRLLMLFCSKCKGETLHETEMAFYWRVTETDVKQTKEVFIEKGFINDDWEVLNWNRRQYISDSSTDRVRAYRDRKKQNETFHETGETKNVTAPEQNRTDTEQIQKTAFVLPDYVPAELWEEFEKQRKKLKKPLTDKTRKIALNRLVKAHASGYDVTAAMELCLEGMWQTFHVDEKTPKRKRVEIAVDSSEYRPDMWADLK